MQKMQQYRVAPHEGRSPKIMNCSVEEDIFIDMVRRERPLWDKKDRDYKNLDVKNRLWKSIAVKCETTDLECKRRWTGLREKYRREKIFNFKQRRLGMAVDFTQRWRNYLNMVFLDQVYTPRGNYQKSNGSALTEERADNEHLKELDQMDVKYEDGSSNDCNVNDYLETTVNSGSHTTEFSGGDASPKDSNYPSATTSTSQLNDDLSLHANRINPALMRAPSVDSFPRIWVNSLPNLSIIPRNLKDEDSSSPAPSQHSDRKSQTATNHRDHDNSYINSAPKNVNKYSSFGQYIADTLHEMDDKYANELHVQILQEIIKIKSKILKES